jgi:hypothetical protein
MTVKSHHLPARYFETVLNDYALLNYLTGEQQIDMAPMNFIKTE